MIGIRDHPGRQTMYEFVQISIMLAIAAVIVSAIALFIIDGIKAKKEHRKRKVGITVYFIIVMILTAFFAIMFALFLSLAAIAIRSM